MFPTSTDFERWPAFSLRSSSRCRRQVSSISLEFNFHESEFKVVDVDDVMGHTCKAGV